jgi:hypothetical protein
MNVEVGNETGQFNFWEYLWYSASPITQQPPSDKISSDCLYHFSDISYDNKCKHHISLMAPGTTTSEEVCLLVCIG